MGRGGRERKGKEREKGERVIHGKDGGEEEDSRSSSITRVVDN